MQQNTSRAICDECGGDVVYHTKDDFALDVYSDNDFILKIKEPRFVCSRCGKEFDEFITIYKEEL
jgi:DNA-directed RNA polymerase subunit RPC12/RpoP